MRIPALVGGILVLAVATASGAATVFAETPPPAPGSATTPAATPSPHGDDGHGAKPAATRPPGRGEDRDADATRTPVAGATARPTERGDDHRPEGTRTPGPGATARPTEHGERDGKHEPPRLPENASPKAKAAVEKAFERQEQIREIIASLHDVPPGPQRDQFVSDLIASLRDLFGSARDAGKSDDSASPTPGPTATGTPSPAATATGTPTTTATPTAAP